MTDGCRIEIFKRFSPGLAGRIDPLLETAMPCDVSATVLVALGPGHLPFAPDWQMAANCSAQREPRAMLATWLRSGEVAQCEPMAPWLRWLGRAVPLGN